MSDFHTAFWSLVGGSSPVLALTNAVAVSATFEAGLDAAREFEQRRKRRGPGRPMPTTAEQVFDRFKVPAFGAVLGYFLSIVALTMALIALGTETESTLFMVIAGVVPIAALSTIAVQALALARARAILKLWEDPDKD